MIKQNIKWIMLVAGIITFTMIFALFSPNQTLHAMFGLALEGELSELIVRNWGALIALTGGMLIYAAFNPTLRPMTLVVSGISKITFIALLLSHGFAQKMLPTLIMDSVFVCLFAYYLLSHKQVTASE
jgi:hypothetical protein